MFEQVCFHMSLYTERTKITDQPHSVHLAYDESFVEFYCAATSDESTPINLSWFRVGSSRPVVGRSGRVNVTISDDGTTLSFAVRANDTEGWAMLTGQYECRATNGYSSEVANFDVSIEPPPSPLYPHTTPRSNLVYLLSLLPLNLRGLI